MISIVGNLVLKITQELQFSWFDSCLTGRLNDQNILSTSYIVNSNVNWVSNKEYCTGLVMSDDLKIPLRNFLGEIQ